VSGATTNYATVVPIRQFPFGVKNTAQHPGGPGYKADAEFALRVQSLAAQQAMAAAAQRQAAVAAYQSTKTTRCVSFFNTVTCN